MASNEVLPEHDNSKDDSVSFSVKLGVSRYCWEYIPASLGHWVL